MKGRAVTRVRVGPTNHERPHTVDFRERDVCLPRCRCRRSERIAVCEDFRVARKLQAEEAIAKSALIPNLAAPSTACCSVISGMRRPWSRVSVEQA